MYCRENETVGQSALSLKMSEKHIRVAVVGNVNAGKSSLIGTLKSGHLDDGDGSARSKIMIHKHEIETGRTSTIASHLLGFDDRLNPLSMPNPGAKVDATIAAKASKLVTLVDLAGHDKYLKTTVHGVSSGMIDYALVLVNSRQPPTHMTHHHISLAIACGIPTVIVMTKTDGCPEHVLKSTKEDINKTLRSPDVMKKPYHIKNPFDITIVKDKLHAITPIISISCVTGEGLDLLSTFLCLVPKRRRHQQKIGRKFEYLVEDIFQITGIGTVVSGFVNAGRAQVGQKVFIGPVNGSFIETHVKSAQIARTHVNSIMAGNNACLALALNKEERKMIRKGMVVLEFPAETSSIFEADMSMLKGSGVDGTTIRKNYETMIHILHMKQCARVEKVEILEHAGNGYPIREHLSEGDVVVRPGSKARITFHFLQRKVFMRKGMRVLFRDGHVRGCGVITKVG